MAIGYQVWDVPTRIVHCLFIVLVLLQWGTAEWGWLSMEWHFRFGYAMLGLLLFRVLWGFIGSGSTRFKTFLRGPRAVLRYTQGLSARLPEGHATHNPLGGWSVVALLSLLAFQVATGLFSSDDITAYGPYAEWADPDWVSWATRWHKLGQWLLLALIALHVLGVLWHALVKREDLVTPMLTGRKHLQVDPQVRFAGAWHVVAAMLVSAALAWLAVAAAGWLAA